MHPMVSDIDLPDVELSAADRKLLAQVEPSLARGKEVYEWWKKTEDENAYAERFPLRRSPFQARESFGFYDRAKLARGVTPVLGVVQNMSFCRSEIENLRDQVREFALHYFLRAASFEVPAAFTLRELRGEKIDDSDPAGWGYSQVYYKLRSGKIGKFPTGLQQRIFDLRHLLNGDFQWIVLRARLFNVEVDLNPAGDATPHLVVPLSKFTEEYLVASPEFIVDEIGDGSSDLVGRFGFGYATIKDPSYDRGPLLWGPGRFDPGFESFLFELRHVGQGVTAVDVVSPFTVNRPDRIFGVNPDPIAGAARLLPFHLAARFAPSLLHGFDPLLTPAALLASASGGLSDKLLGISVDNIEKYFLVQHFFAVYGLLNNALLTFNQVPDWTAPIAQMPDFARQGEPAQTAAAA